jgi:hypothetical protein
VNILNERRGQPTRGVPLVWGLGQVFTTHLKNMTRYKPFHNVSYLEKYLGLDRDRCQARWFDPKWGHWNFSIL